MVYVSAYCYSIRKISEIHCAALQKNSLINVIYQSKKCGNHVRGLILLRTNTYVKNIYIKSRVYSITYFIPHLYNSYLTELHSSLIKSPNRLILFTEKFLLDRKESGKGMHVKYCFQPSACFAKSCLKMYLSKNGARKRSGSAPKEPTGQKYLPKTSG